MNKTPQPSHDSWPRKLIAVLASAVVALCTAVSLGYTPSATLDSLISSSMEAAVGSQEEARSPETQADEQNESSTTSDDETDDTKQPGYEEASEGDGGTSSGTPTRGPTVEEDGTYTSKDEVALYLHTFGHLPSNYITKSEARKQGWVASQGNLHKACPGKSIGGDYFSNYEGLLPDASGRTWTECDINYVSGRRGTERIVFSNDGLIYYTSDHYKSFVRLY
jgi:guanyl-specific ribonuclease Sa